MRQLRLEVANGLVELEFPGINALFDHRAQLLALKQDHLRPKSGTFKRGAHACRATTDHCNPTAGELFAGHASTICRTLAGLWARNRWKIAFVTGPRVDQAGRHLLLEYMVQARLIASNAGADVLGTRHKRLLDQMGVGQNGLAMPIMSAHLCQSLLVHGRIVEAVGVTKGTLTAPMSFFVTNRNPPRAPSWQWLGFGLHATRCPC